MHQTPEPGPEPRPRNDQTPPVEAAGPASAPFDGAAAHQAPVPSARPVPGWLLPTVTGVVGVIVGAAGSALLSSVSAAGTPDTFTAAVDACELNYKNSLARIGDEGASLVLDHQGADEAGGLS